MRHGVSILLWAALVAAPGFAHGSTTEVDPRIARLEQALSFVEAKAYTLARIDWPATKRAAHEALQQTPGEAGLTAAIRHALGALDDGHSFYAPPQVPGSAPRPSVPQAEARAPIAVFDGSKAMPVVAIHGWTGDAAAMRTATALVRTTLAKALAHPSCGLVLDLRGNRGGNVWPMVAGLVPLFAPGVLQTWVDRTGKEKRTEIVGGSLHYDGKVHFLSTAPPAGEPSRPRHVALLLGPRTASSGELLAIGFAGHPNVRRFGSRTAGATTANASLPLPDGAVLAVMSSRVRDRTGAMVDGPLVPDEITAAPMDAAQAWLRSRCADASAQR